MTTLSEWLRDDHEFQRLRLEEVEARIAEALPLLLETQQGGCWHYELPTDRSVPESTSTIAMVTYAIKLLGLDLPDDLPVVSRGAYSRDHLKEHKASKDVIGEAVTALAKTIVERTPNLYSGTFGSNDPLSLYFALAVLPTDDDNVAAAVRVVTDRAKERCASVSKAPSEPALKYAQGDESEAFSHTMPVTYFMRIAKAIEARERRSKEEEELKAESGAEAGLSGDAENQDAEPESDAPWTIDDQIDRAALETYFDNEFLSQMSFSDLQHAEFDIAQFVFALEGALLVKPDLITDAKFDKAAEIVSAHHLHSPDLRPKRPVRSNPRGDVILPVTVEVATSLLRTSMQLDTARPSLQAFAKLRDVFSGYFDWLVSQQVEIEHDGSRYQGWHSDHFHGNTTKVHTWQTALVLVFLGLYAEALHRDAAQQAQRAGRFRPELWNKSAEDRTKGWTKAQEDEPFLTGADDSIYRVYNHLDRAFIGPRQRNGTGRKSYSMLLHGPPGTGKSLLAERIAEALGWTYLEFTPSDFIAGGPSEVEARAKDLFAALQLQSECVIFFDEIDRLILDRASEGYQQQSDMFQFMTPSMLTKINDLRKAKRTVFCIATNYAWRIDPAITRPGRIDHHYLVLPPNLAQRKRILDRRKVKDLEPRFGEDLTDNTIVESLARLTPLFSWVELNSLVDDALDGSTDLQEFEDRFKELRETRSPAIRSDVYAREIDDLLGPPTEESKTVAEIASLVPKPLIEEYVMVRYVEVEVEAVSVRTDQSEVETWRILDERRLSQLGGTENVLKQIRDRALHDVMRARL